MFDRKFDDKFNKNFDSAFDKKVKPISKKLDKIQKTLDLTIRLFDTDVLDLKKRVETLEAHPNLNLKLH